MKASEAKMLDLLYRSRQFIIPIFQRTYSWTERECKQLWDDIVRVGNQDQVSAHFVGSIVYIEQGLSQATRRSPFMIIDGQQRLTTLSLILEALSRQLNGYEPLEGFSSEKIRHDYLLNVVEHGDKRYKLLLTQTDKDSLISIMERQDYPEEFSYRIKENFDFFMEQIRSESNNLDIVCKGLDKLTVVDISLDRNQDNPQLIFESMNSTGLELSQADLIRNFVLMGMNQDQQTSLYKSHWRPMEVAFGQEAYGKLFDGFMRHYLTLKTGDIPKINKVYEAFKAYYRRPEIVEKGVDALVADIHVYAGYYCAMALGKEKNQKLALAFRDLQDLRVDVAYPFLLELYYDWKEGLLSLDEFELIIRLVESYVFRRAVCNIPTNSLNKTFATFTRNVNKNRYLESIQAQFLLLPSYRRFPQDEEFRREIMVRDLYNFRIRSYWLRRMENYGRKERVFVDEYTIEHILPQNENLSTKWQEDLGPDWKQVQETWLHTLGNLTLTGYNPELSDRPFLEKRNMEGGFKDSPLRVNENLGVIDSWNEEAIKDRAEKLAQQAAGIWLAPSLNAETLDTYRIKPEKPDHYTLADHPYLTVGSEMYGDLVPGLFEALRKEILSLDPNVSEEILKLYIAYKAETNFVDVVPQAKKLRLSMNMKFHEIHDPRGLAKDVTNLGRWGNGDVEVGLETLEDLPYVMGLIRQAFEKQMGNEVEVV